MTRDGTTMGRYDGKNVVVTGLKAEFTAVNPMQRFGHPDEFAPAVAFLAFDATFVAGMELVVDGGHSQL
ncbi:SDR family oxidoreductase [Mycobacterium sp. 21AC1]|uniref:SDR family oxidoreductase n=1 Tax=[Mycobacterium] appelbergii TaxID=2939269 RepID=UPI002938D844|nr:SDR family oxidoreductase [Mycobacterium sp. 21AC1]MDV3123529.1 SDR family oxidoreductase [Mycobacterium sp. 21AC1]